MLRPYRHRLTPNLSDLQPLYEYTDETVKKEKRLYNNERNVPYRTKWNNSSATLVNPSTVVAAASRGSGSMPTSGNIEALAGSKGSGGSHAKQRKAPTRNQSKDKPPEPLS